MKILQSRQHDQSWHSGLPVARSHKHSTAGYLTLALIAAFTVLLLGACGNSRSPAASGSPVQPDLPASTGNAQKLTREQAEAIATEAFTRDHSFATAVDDPHDMVMRLMRFRELHGSESLPGYGLHSESLVWIAQVAGTSRSTLDAEGSRGRSRTYRFNAVAVHATTGAVISRMQSEYEPFILPLEFLPPQLVNAGIDEREVQRDLLPISRDDAVQILMSGNVNTTNRNLEAIETALVRYSNPAWPGGDSVGPEPTPTAVPTAHWPTSTAIIGPTPFPTATAAPRFIPTSTPVVDRLSWLVILPGELGFSSCFISGPSGESHLTCWMSVVYFFVDAQTGDVYEGDQTGYIGPSVTNDESVALQRFAWSQGWWSLWHEVHQYNGERLPQGLAARMDPPTFTPGPPTPTPVAVSPPTQRLTPTPPPPPTPTPKLHIDATETPRLVIAEGAVVEGNWTVRGYLRGGTFCLEFELNGNGTERCGYTRAHFMNRLPIWLLTDSAILYGFTSKDVVLVRVELGNGETLEAVPADSGYEPNNYFALQLGPPLDFSQLDLVAIGEDGEELERMENTLETSSIRQ